MIHEWEGTIEQLESQLAPGKGDFSLERLKKRRMKEGKAVWEEGKAILIKIRGDSLPTKLLIGYGHVWLRVEPFVEAVRQCFKCLKFGHIQVSCRTSRKRYFVCTKEAHGRPRCINCGEAHMSVARECKVFQREAAIKKIMAYKNVSYNAAFDIVKREERNSKFGGKDGDEEESEEEEWDNNFPSLRRKKKIEYWENLSAPVEKELSRLRKTWEWGRGNQNQNQSQNKIRNRSYQNLNQNQNHYQNQNYNQRETREEERRKVNRQDMDNNRESARNRWNQEYGTDREDKTAQKWKGSGPNRDGLEEKRMWDQKMGSQRNNWEGAYKKDTKFHRQTEEGGRREETKCMQDTEHFRNKGEEDLIEEIVKLINDRNILAKVVKKLVDSQRATQMVGESITNEEDWNRTKEQCKESSPQGLENTTNKTKPKVKLVNVCLTKEDHTKTESVGHERVLGEEEIRGGTRTRTERVGREEKIEIENQSNKVMETGEEKKGKEDKKDKIINWMMGVKGKEMKEEGSEEKVEERSSSETEEWNSVTTGSEDARTIEWLEENETEQEDEAHEGELKEMETEEEGAGSNRHLGIGSEKEGWEEQGPNLGSG